MQTIIGYHFVQENGASRMGQEKPFDVGEYRRIERPDDIVLCRYGYHGVKEPSDALVGSYIYGPLVECAEYDAPIKSDKEKFVSAGKRVLARVNVRIPLLLFAADCAERVLPFFEKAHPDDNRRVRECIEGMRAFLRGEITRDELLNLRSAATAYAPAYVAASAAAYVDAAALAVLYVADAAASAAAAYYVADAAAAAARRTERVWQREQFNQMILTAFEKS